MKGVLARRTCLPIYGIRATGHRNPKGFAISKKTLTPFRPSSVLAGLALAVLLASPTAVRAGCTTIKGGVLLFADDSGEIDANDRWWVAVGHDWSTGTVAFVGFELQSGFRRDVIGGKLDSRVVPLNAFLNFRWKAPRDGVRPYAGGGMGLASALVWTDVSAFPRSFTTFDYETALGYQAFGGVEIRRRWIVEALFQRTFASVGNVAVNFQPVPKHSLSIAAGVTW